MADDTGNGRTIGLVLLLIVGIVVVLPVGVTVVIIVALTVLGASLESKFEAIEAEVAAVEAAPPPVIPDGPLPARVAAAISLDQPPGAKLNKSEIANGLVSQEWAIETGDPAAAMKVVVADAESQGFVSTYQTAASYGSVTKLARADEMLDVTLVTVSGSTPTLRLEKAGRTSSGPVAPPLRDEDVPAEVRSVAPPEPYELIGVTEGDEEHAARFQSALPVSTLLTHVGQAHAAAGWTNGFESTVDGTTSFGAGRGSDILVVLISATGQSSAYDVTVRTR